MAKSIALARSSAFREQAGRCIYCGAPMWSHSPQEYAKARGISLADARRFQATAEHLKARSEGGSNSRRNIVAACFFCNQKRHRRKAAPAPDAYQALVQGRIAHGKWHPAHLHGKVLSQAHLKT
ncbi:MAG: HNH endonuclease [Proteobacteria bacterium]|nr:HNH endonuclease [Pseudomonadota bacterium]